MPANSSGASGLGWRPKLNANKMPQTTAGAILARIADSASPWIGRIFAALRKVLRKERPGAQDAE